MYVDKSYIKLAITDKIKRKIYENLLVNDLSDTVFDDITDILYDEINFITGGKNMITKFKRDNHSGIKGYQFYLFGNLWRFAWMKRLDTQFFIYLRRGWNGLIYSRASQLTIGRFHLAWKNEKFCLEDNHKMYNLLDNHQL